MRRQNGKGLWNEALLQSGVKNLGGDGRWVPECIFGQRLRPLTCSKTTFHLIYEKVKSGCGENKSKFQLSGQFYKGHSRKKKKEVGITPFSVCGMEMAHSYQLRAEC